MNVSLRILLASQEQSVVHLDLCFSSSKLASSSTASLASGAGIGLGRGSSIIIQLTYSDCEVCAVKEQLLSGHHSIVKYLECNLRLSVERHRSQLLAVLGEVWKGKVEK